MPKRGPAPANLFAELGAAAFFGGLVFGTPYLVYKR